MCLETLVLLVPIGQHLMYTKILDQKVGGVRREGVVLCVLEWFSNQTHPRQVMLLCHLVWKLWPWCFFSHFLRKFLLTMQCWRIGYPLHFATSCSCTLETNKNLIPKFLRKKETTVFSFILFYGFLALLQHDCGKMSSSWKQNSKTFVLRFLQPVMLSVHCHCPRVKEEIRILKL